jgi:hypothetical protein
MAYSKIKLADIEQRFGVTLQRKRWLPDEIASVEASDLLKGTLLRGQNFALTTEKARSEMQIAPVLSEIQILNLDKISVFSGENLPAEPKKGLNGEIDFMIAAIPNAVRLQHPIITVVEAKKADLDLAYDQSVAQMIGAKVFNEKNTRTPNPQLNIFGIVTNGVEWQFLTLQENTVLLDPVVYTLNNLGLLLGTIQYIIQKAPC